MAKLTYAAWVNIKLKPLTKEHQQELRGKFYSPKSKIARYDEYKLYCKSHGLDYEKPPEGYLASKEEPWHKPAGTAMIVGGYFVWFLGKFLATGVSTRKMQ